MEGGARRPLIDAYRHLHGYGREEFSWFVKRKARRIGRRFDHVFCSREFVIKGCEYLHRLREDGLAITRRWSLTSNTGHEHCVAEVD